VRQFEKYALVFMRTYLGGFNLISGLNFFLHFWPQPIPGDALGKAYMDATLQLGLFQFAKLLEVVGGFCLLFNVCVPFGLVVLFPVTFTVLVMNVFFSPFAHIQVSGGRNFAFHAILLAAYAGYFLPLLKLKAPIRPIWRGLGRAPADPAADLRSPAE
jgi:hypothetical protein